MISAKKMYYNMILGSCTSISTYYSAIWRIIGIPSRIRVEIPIFDPVSEAQREIIENNIKNDKVRNEIIENSWWQGWSNHLEQEVYIGYRWIITSAAFQDSNYHPISLKVMDVKDQSEFMAGKYWLPVMDKITTPGMSSTNPQRLLSIEDSYGIHNK